MMKRMVTIFLALLLAAALVLPVSANEQKIVDLADLLTEAEETDLNRKAQDLAEQYGMDVVIVTVHDTGGTDITQYADDYFDYNGYGLGDDYSGVLFLLAIDTRDWAMSTSGEAIYALTDYGLGELFEAMADDLSQDRFYWAFDAYLSELPYYFQAYADGNPIDGSGWDDYDGPGYLDPADRGEVVYQPVEPKDFWDYAGILFTSLLIGAAAGGIVLLILRGQMKTDVAQKGACSYLVQGSYQLTRQQDLFLYSNVSRVRRARDTDSGGSRGIRGGSSVHRSSSGRSHGGRSGKF